MFLYLYVVTKRAIDAVIIDAKYFESKKTTTAGYIWML